MHHAGRMRDDPNSSAAGAPVGLFCVDLNGTLLGNPEATAHFTTAWRRRGSGERPALVYTCGRSVDEIRRVVAEHRLPEPTAVIGGLGTTVSIAGHDAEAAQFNERFASCWNFSRVDELVSKMTGIARGAAAFLFPYRPEWSWHNASPHALKQLQARLAEAGIHGSVRYTFNRHLDVVPADTSKGEALSYVCSLLTIPLEAVLVAGDTLHDASMMLLPKVRRIVVENSLPDLLAELVGREKFMSNEVMANGVIDGLRHFGVLPRRRFQ